MHFVDTHTHLYSEAFKEDQDQMISRALDAGVKSFYLPAIDSETTQAMYNLQRRYPKAMHLMMGLHPTSVKPESFKTELAHVKKQLELRDFCAIGEIGVDLYWDKSTCSLQQDCFRIQIQWAKEKKLPIVIHCREAFDEVFEVLEEEKSENLYGIFHCFTGTLEQAKRAISFNMKLGIGGVLTFKNGKIDQFLNQLSIDHMVLETDSPYLSPKPFRGKRNESSYLVYIAQKLADIYNISLEKVAEKTTQNALSVFKNYK
ncbi:TatD family hydrolase [Mesonia sp. HuA40]|uniref:TatD family hydrolase n=1 Tax=Mesonia sp. HuA40 TaxID=2602761 RepID=UPI0011CB480B|nr:TatD family hydrolase [Mesonia sp. HuA40]TXK71518.1 TatD family deoxyribonuclease [Mesonia sp. HuA40]